MIRTRELLGRPAGHWGPGIYMLVVAGERNYFSSCWGGRGLAEAKNRSQRKGAKGGKEKAGG